MSEGGYVRSPVAAAAAANDGYRCEVIQYCRRAMVPTFNEPVGGGVRQRNLID